MSAGIAGFIIGLLLGGPFGWLAAALCIIAREGMDE